MAKKKVVTNTREETEIEVPAVAAEVPEVESSGADPWDELMGADDGTRYKVHKEPSRAGEKRQYCYTYTKEDMSLDTIRETFGGGTYRVTVTNDQGRYVRSGMVSIIDLPKAPGAAVVPASAGAPSPANDPTQLMLMKFMEGQSAMISALLSREMAPPPAGPTAMELVTLIKALQPADSERSDPVKLLLQGLELGKGLGGGGTDFMDLAKTGLESLAPLIKAQASAPAAPVRRVAPPPARIANGHAPAPASESGAAQAEPAPAAPTPEEEVKLEIVKKLKWLTAITADLVVRASKQKDPELYAEVFLDNLPPFITLEEVAERFREPSSIAMLAQLDPNVMQFAPWFEDFRIAVNSMIEEEEEEMPGASDIERETDKPSVLQ